VAFFGQAPRQSMFAPAAADDEDFHGKLSV
jgi:hypothetical protein